VEEKRGVEVINEHNDLHRSLHSDMQMSGWLEVQLTKDDWKFCTKMSGEQSATTISTTLMLASSVILLDTG